MRWIVDGDTLRVSEITELDASNANSFRVRTQAALSEGQKTIEIDLSRAQAVDSGGLGALIALHKLSLERGGTLRLLNPTAPVQQLLELTRLHQVFEIVCLEDSQ